jgi:hypothetical protein
MTVVRLLPEIAAMSPATSSSFALSRAARQTWTPSRASSAAIDAPMPRLAPVTNATLPPRFKSMPFPSRFRPVTPVVDDADNQVGEQTVPA